MFNISFATNLMAIAFILLGLISPVAAEQFKSIGIFALSGALTNWLAVHMLFEKVPLLYGSGIIPNRFEEFKVGIHSLIMGEFFNEANIKNFFEQRNRHLEKIDMASIVEIIDFHKFFDGLLEVINASQFGSMLSMFGGVAALEPMRTPFIDKMKITVLSVGESDEFQLVIKEKLLSSDVSSGIQKKVEQIVDKRLDELTPQMVKVIIQEMIKKHLGWLVVWGGVFGGLIGFVVTFF